MRKLFPAYYIATEEFFKRLWERGTFVLDANMLLNFFRYSAETRESLHTFLAKNEARLWLPHQVAIEYHRNLHSVRYAPVAAIEKLITHLEQDRDRLREEDHRARVQKLVDDAQRYRDEARTKLSSPEEKTWIDRIADLYEGRVGRPWVKDELKTLTTEGEDRYKSKIPPGFRDASKDGGETSEKFGDLIVWKQLIEYAKTLKAPLMFITDDAKDDWWQRIGGERQGPHPDLLNEMAAEAPDSPFYMYSGKRFLDQAKDVLGAELTTSAIAEVERVAAEQHAAKAEQIADLMMPALLRRALMGQSATELPALHPGGLPVGTETQSGRPTSVLKMLVDGMMREDAAAAARGDAWQNRAWTAEEVKAFWDQVRSGAARPKATK